MTSSMRLRAYPFPTLAIVLAVGLTLGFGAFVTGDEQNSVPQKPISTSPDPSANTTKPQGKAGQGKASHLDAPQAAVDTIDPSRVISRLSDAELAAAARSGKLPAALVDHSDLERQRLNEMLLQELARRLERQVGMKSEPNQITNELDVKPSAPESAARNDPVRQEHVFQPPLADEGEPNEVIIERAVTEIVTGTPMGVGHIELVFVSGHGPVIYPDQSPFLHAIDQRTHYAVFNLDYQQVDGSSPYQVRRIEAMFLVHGQSPVELSLHSPQGELFNEKVERGVDDAVALRRLKQQWWQSFSTIPADISDDHRQLKVTLLDILARRHGFSIPHSSKSSTTSKDLEGLETQFERAIGMLFGIESVKLAMQDDVTLRDSTRREIANVPVPAPPRMRSITIPDFRAVPIEPIAMHVPAECFYVRTGNAANYLYFRKFLTGWGGSLDDIVSHGAFDHEVRRKLEFQLGLDSEKMSTAALDDSLSDMALIGCDPLFHQGAAVGVLFEAKSGVASLAEIENQRARIRQEYEEVDERRLNVGRHSVSFLSTDDHRVRSFYAIDGRYHLITNSEYILDRFFEAGQGDRALGQLREFGYARSKAKPKGDSLAFLYLSDPFFQNLVSPHYRIEMTRRAVAARELQQLQLARLIARAEHVQAKTINDLVEASLLPNDFGNRPDRSRATYRGNYYQDTLRGVRGMFLPVPDVTLLNATRTEIASYQQFVREYNSQWGRIDPVTVVFSKQPSPNEIDLHRIGLDILVTPYARQRYALLNNHLADPSQRQLAPLANDLLSVQAAVRLGRMQPSHLLSIGLRDDEVPFAIQHGKVQLLGEKLGSTFAKSRCYAAITPPSTNILRMLGSVLLQRETPSRLVQRKPAIPPPNRLPPPMPLTSMAPQSGQLLYLFAWAISNLTPEAAGAAKYVPMIETRDGVTIVSETDWLRDQVFAEIREERRHDPHKVQLRMGALRGAKVEPYIQAFTYVDARRASSQSAQLLNEWSDWLRLPAGYSRATIESLLSAKIRCPLGGDFTSEPLENRVHWTGTAWGNESLYQVTEIPADWKFPFLDWLQGLDLRFDLDQTTLRAQIDLDVRMDVDPEGDTRLVNLNAIVTNAILDDQSQQVFLGESFLDDEVRESNEWVLGIRVPRDNRVLTVSVVHPNSPASRAGIRAGDIIERIDGRKPESSVSLVKFLAEAQRSGIVHVDLNRQGTKIRLRIALTQ